MKISSDLLDIYQMPTFNPNLSTFANACLHLGNTPAHHYFHRVSNLSFHDLTIDKSVPPSTAQLLGLGLKFIINPSKSSNFNDIDIGRFSRDMWLAAWFATPVEVTDNKIREKPSKLYVKSKWDPPTVPPTISQCLNNFFDGLHQVSSSKPGRPNLLPSQKQLLRDLRDDKNLVIANTDKGLGPCAIELHRYINFGLNHLLDSSSYRIISTNEARLKTRALNAAIDEWVDAFEAHPPYKQAPSQTWRQNISAASKQNHGRATHITTSTCFLKCINPHSQLEQYALHVEDLHMD